MILKDTADFQVLFIVSLFCAWNITTAEINSGVHLYLKVKSAKCLCLLPVVLVLLFRSWSCMQRSWSCYFGLGLKNLVLFTSPVLACITGVQQNGDKSVCIKRAPPAFVPEETF